MEDASVLADYTFVGVTNDDVVIFNDSAPKIILMDITKIDLDLVGSEVKIDFERMFQPIVKLENCVWLQEF